MNHYYHWGALGDIIYSLPTVKALGPGHFTTALARHRHDWIAPLLEAQPYITGTSHDPRGKFGEWMRRPVGVTHDLNSMRRPQYGPLHIRTLVESHGLPFGLKPDHTPWLTVPDLGPRQSRAVVARSARYQDPEADWDGHLADLRVRYDEVVFVGTPDEHAQFGRSIPRVECATMLDMARLIGESSYFSGNQSSPLSLAIGLGIPHTIEIGPGHSNCTFHDCPYQLALRTQPARPLA